MFSFSGNSLKHSPHFVDPYEYKHNGFQSISSAASSSALFSNSASASSSTSISSPSSRKNISLSHEQLDQITKIFSLHNSSPTSEECFQVVLEACRKQRWGLLDEAEKKNLLSEFVNRHGRTILLQVLAEGDLNLATELIKRKINILGEDTKNNKPIHYIAEKGNEVLLRLILPHNDPNATNVYRQIPLHLAARTGNNEVVRILIAQKADINSLATFKIDNRKFEKMTPCYLAAIYGHMSTLRIFLQAKENKPNFNIQVPEMGHILHGCLQFGTIEILKELFGPHFNHIKSLLSVPNSKGHTPLMLAAYLGHTTAMCLLKEHDVNIEINERDPSLQTPLHLAARGRQKNSIDLLAHFRANFRAEDNNLDRPVDVIRPVDDPESLDLTVHVKALMRQSRELDRTLPVLYTLTPPLNLVFQGGGPKGLAYIGVQKVLEKENLIAGLKRIAGSSAGAMMAALIAVGYNSTEIEEIIPKNLEEFLDGIAAKELIQFYQNPSFRTGCDVAAAAISAEFFIHPVESIKKLWTKTGICAGDAFLHRIEEIIAEKVGPLCTFGELANKVKQYPHLFKHLHIFTSHLTQHKWIQISSEDPKWKDVIISDAIRASISIPGLFEPHVLHVKTPKGRRPEPTLGTHVDGGILYNFPLEAFDKEQYFPSNAEGDGENFTNMRTLGFSLYSPEEKNSSSKGPETIRDLLDQVGALFSSVEINLHQLNPKNQFRTVLISNEGIGTLELNLGINKQMRLIDSGIKAMQKFWDDQKMKSSEECSRNAFSRVVIEARGFRVLPMHPFFVKRPELTNQIHKAFFNKGGVRAIQLLGMGGMGKSELAIAFANIYFEEFSLIWTIEADTSNKIAQGFRDLATHLDVNFDPKSSHEQLAELIYKYLEKQQSPKPYLIIFDDTKQKPTFPINGNGALLITSRRHHPDIEPIYVGAFTPSEAFEIFNTIVRNCRKEPTLELLKELEYHPLSIIRVAREIADTPGMNVESYLKNFLEMKEVFYPKKAKIEYTASQAVSWGFTFKNLQASHPRITDWLEICSLISTSAIPVSWIDLYLCNTILNPLTRADQKNILLQVLTDNNLIRYDETKDQILIHPSLQTFLKDQMDSDLKEKTFKNVVLLFEKVFQNLNHEDPVDWPTFVLLKPHLLVLKKEEFGPRLLEMFEKLAMWERQMGRPQEALRLLEYVLSIRKTKPIESDPLAYTRIFSLLGVTLGYLGKLTEAMIYLEKALKIYKDQLNNDSTLLMKVALLENMGVIYTNLGNFEKARDYFEHSLEIVNRRECYSDELAAICFINLGTIGVNTGNYQKGFEFHDKALTLFKKIHPTGRHHDIGLCLANLAETSNALGDYQKATFFCKQAFSLFLSSELYSNGVHPAIAMTRFIEGKILYSLGKYLESKKSYLDALQIFSLINPDEKHPDIIKTKNNLGKTLNALGEYQEAKAMLEDVLGACEHVYKEGKQPEIARSKNYLGDVYNKLGDYQKAKNYYEEALKLLEEIHPKGNHPEIANSKNSLGNVLNKLGDSKQAKIYHEQALMVYENQEIYPNRKHRDIAFTLSLLGEAWNKLGDKTQAIEYYNKALKMYQEVYPNGKHPDIEKTLKNLGEIKNELGNYQQAKEYYERALQINEEFLGQNHPETIQTKQNLAVVGSGVRQFQIFGWTFSW